MIVQKILEKFPELDIEDVRCTVGQEGGADIKLSKKARTFLPIKIEAKNRENLTQIYTFYEQAKSHKEEGEPVLIIKKNFKKPLVIMDLDYYLELLKEKNNG